MRHDIYTHTLVSLHERLCLNTQPICFHFTDRMQVCHQLHTFRFTHTPHCLALFLSPVLLVSGDEGPISASVWSLEKPYTRQRQRDRPEEKGGNGVT